MRKDREEIENYINKLKSYEGYVQFSHRPIDLKKDIFPKSDDIDENDFKDGFIYEVHFFNGKDSITIKQINESWLVDKVENIPLKDTQTYMGINNLKIKMAQIWEEKPDELCEGMEVKKLQKVVFAGFVN